MPYLYTIKRQEAGAEYTNHVFLNKKYNARNIMALLYDLHDENKADIPSLCGEVYWNLVGNNEVLVWVDEVKKVTEEQYKVIEELNLNMPYYKGINLND